MQNKKSIRIFFAALLLFLVSVLLFLLVGSFSKVPASAKEKTKWQKLLEKNGIDRLLWEKYLPKITKKEYNKIKKYLSATIRKSGNTSAPGAKGSLHSGISTTIFWIGEDGSADNHNISNAPSAWDEKWVQHFGGIDNPDKRNGFMPAGFTPKENPFYFALPYNDFDSNGNRKKNLASYIPWYNQKNWNDSESVCKNQWIKIAKGNKVAYAQWQDAGPFGEDDVNYVFGSSAPKSKTNDHAGLDVSPAVRDYLNLDDVDKCDWQFVSSADVPDGPWKEIVTNSNICWN